MTGFLREPMTIVKGRAFEQPFSWYEYYEKEGSENNEKKDISSGFDFSAEFKYSLDDPTPVVSLTMASGLSVNADNDLILSLTDAQTDLFEVALAQQRNRYPFVPVFFEIMYTENSGPKKSFIIGKANVFKEVIT